MLGGLGGGGDDEGDPYNFDMGGGDDFGGFGQSDSFDDAPKRPAKKAPPKRPTSKGGRSLGPKPISSDVGTKTFKKASASDVLAKAQAMLSKAPTGSGQKKKESRRSRSPSMDADGIMANLSSSEDGSPKKKTTTLRRLDTQSFEPDSSFAEEEGSVDMQPQQATSPVNDDDDENILNSEIARQSVYGQVRDASALVQEEEVSEDEVAEEEEEENPPLTETAKAQFTSSIHGNVRSITDLPSRLGAPPTRDSSQFEFGAEVLQSPRAPAAAPSQSPQKLPPRQPKPKMRRQVSFDAAHASRDDAVQMRESNEEEPLDESVADESLERSPALSGRPFASDNSGEFLRESIDDETYSEEFHEGTMSRTASPRAPAGPPLVPPVQQGPPASVVAPPIPAVAPAPAPPPPPPQKPTIVADDLPCGVDFTPRLDKVPLSELDGSVTRLVEEDVSRALGIPRRVVQVTSVRESLAGPQASVLECRIQVKDGASARRLGEVLTRAPPILLERQAPDFSSCRYLDRVRVRDDPSPKAMPTAYPFGEATKIRGPASGPQPVRLLVYDEDEDEDVDVDEAEGALHLVRTREVATQFCGNDASIQTAYVPTTMGAAHPAFKAMTEATDAAMNSLDPASFLEQPPPPPPQPYMYGYPPQPYMMMPPPQVSPTVMKEARADFDRMLRDQQKLHDMLASVRQDLEKAHADVMKAVPQTAMPPAASVIKEPRPPDLPYWKAYMDVDPSLSEQEARELAFNDVKGNTTLGTGPVGAEEAKAGGPRE